MCFTSLSVQCPGGSSLAMTASLIISAPWGREMQAPWPPEPTFKGCCLCEQLWQGHKGGMGQDNTIHWIYWDEALREYLAG